MVGVCTIYLKANSEVSLRTSDRPVFYSVAIYRVVTSTTSIIFSSLYAQPRLLKPVKINLTRPG